MLPQQAVRFDESCPARVAPQRGGHLGAHAVFGEIVELHVEIGAQPGQGQRDVDHPNDHIDQQLPEQQIAHEPG